MNVSEIRYTNVGIILDLVVPCGSVTVASGSNGSGKSTLIEGIRDLFDGGHNPGLIGPNGDKAVVEVAFSDGKTARKTTNVKGYELKVMNRDGSVMPSPAKYIQGLASGLALDPTGLVDASQKDRVKVLQNAMPIQFSREEVMAACELPVDALPPTMDVQAFNAFRQGRYVQRTEVNRAHRDLSGTHNTLAKSLPEDDGADWASEADRIALEYTSVRERIGQIASKADVMVKEEVARLRDEAQKQIDSIRDVLNRSIAEVSSTASTTVQAETDGLTVESERLAAEAARAKEKAETKQRALGVRDSLTKINLQLKEKIKLTSALDRTIAALDTLKQKKLDGLPIQGVEIREGQIYYNGLNFDTQLNTAQKYLLAFQVAALTLGECPFMIFDGAESLDSTNRRELIEAIKGAGFQVVMAEVVDEQKLSVSAA